ncbi:uncharacterized protein LOC100712577 isoform X2 [Oreochromis niloticus]|uniref:uncharacterized protein LOC100712577 isoform X2 n=1 Tax=Oreochromis niloticus TaxID=8128 RepID=UPI000DF33627|nr:uncharacterized protein LOC100712577 isoform X2 [Oreochromis niloticus]
MSGNETAILQQLAILVVCHGLAVGQISSYYFLLQRPMPWVKAQEFCQKYYVDLAVLTTEEQYFTVLNATPATKVSFWLGLKRQSVSSDWQWVNGEQLGYEHWYRRNYEGCCASLEAMLEKDKNLLARYCKEPHMVVCQGPHSPQSVTVDSVGAEHVNLSWNISAFMQTTPHSYNVTICDSRCETGLYSCTNGSAAMSISISNLTSGTKYFLQISAFVVRPDSVTGGNIILQSNPATVEVKTVDHGIIFAVLMVIKLMLLAPPLCILYHILKKGSFEESNHYISPVLLSTEDTVVDLVSQKTPGIG